jgi:Fic family protein
MAYWKIKYEPGIGRESALDNEIYYTAGLLDSLIFYNANLPVPQSVSMDMFTLQIRHATLGTTAIEGNVLSEKNMDSGYSLKEILKSGGEADQKKEIENAYNTYKYIFSNKPEKPGIETDISEGLIKKLHEMLTMEIVGGTRNTPGEYRTWEVAVGKGDVCEKPGNIARQMKSFVEFINSEEVKNLNGVIRAVLAHFYLVAVHPFGDGNGRTARMLESYILLCYYQWPGIATLLTGFYCERYEEYFRQLRDAKFKYQGDLKHFVIFALDGLYGEVMKAVGKIIVFWERLSYSNYADELCRKKDISSRARSFLEILGHLPDKKTLMSGVVEKSAPVWAALFGKVSGRTVRRDMDALLKHGMITKKGGELGINYEVMKRFTKNVVMPDIKEK